MDFSQLIFGALLQPQPILQKQAEATLMARLNQTPHIFLQQMTHILTNHTADSNLRQASGTILKRSLKLPEKHWMRITVEQRGQIKEMLLGNLITTDKLAKRSSADCISCILSLQLPTNGWPTLIPVLVNNTVHQNVEIRQASIMTLGFICQQVRQVAVQWPVKELQAILAGIFKGLAKENPVEIRKTSIKALRDGVAFMRGLFFRPEIRNLAMNTLCDLIVNSDEKELQQMCFEAVFEMCKHCYQCLDDQIDLLIRSTVPLITEAGKCPLMRKNGLEVWNTLATEFKELKEAGKTVQNYALKHQSDMIQVMLKNLLFYDQDDEDMNGICDSAEQTLCALGQFYSEGAVNLTVNFIGHTLNNTTDPKMRRAGLIAFITILENQNKAMIQTMCMNGLGEFIKRLQDSQVFVREAAAKTLSKVAQSFPQSFFGRMDYSDEFDNVLLSLKDQARVMKNTCWTICYLAEAANKHGCAKFKDRTKKMIDLLIENAVRGEEDDKQRLIIDVCFMAIFNLIVYADNSSFCIEYGWFVLRQLQLVPGKPVSTRQDAYLFGMLTLLHCCLMHFQTQQKKGVKMIVPMDLVNASYSMAIRLFQIIRDVTSEIFYIITAAASLTGIEFSKRLDQIWPYAEHALGRMHDVELIKAVLGMVGDISRAIGGLLQPKVHSLLCLMMEFICNTQFDREGKITVFLTIADLIMNLGEKSIPFLPQMLEIFNLGINACIEFTRNGENQEYTDNLKDVIVESEMCTFHGLRKYNLRNQAFDKHLGYVAEFLKTVSQPQYKPSYELLKNSLYLIGDMLQHAGPRCRGLISNELIKRMTEMVIQMKGREQAKDCVDHVGRHSYHLA